MLNEEQKKYILKNYEDKKAIEIAKELNVPRSKVTNFLWKNNICKRTKWTEDDEAFLKKNYMEMSYSQIAKVLGKTESSCQQRAKKIGIPKKLSGPNTWTKEEISYLKDHIKTDSYESITKHLNRSIGAVYNKVYELKLIPEEAKGYKKIKQEQIWFILANYDKYTDFELGKKFGISAEAVSEIRKKNGIKKDGANSHKITYIEQFVKDELDKYDVEYIFNQPFGNYIPDFRFKGVKVIIEVNGDYYHCNPDVYPDGPKDEVQIKHVLRDYYKMCFYRKEKYKVYYIWENDIVKQPEKIKENIKEIISAVQEQNSQIVLE